jgi:hypothetical protein
MIQRRARTKSESWIHDTYWRPSAARPPSPRLTSCMSFANGPPSSGLMITAERESDLARRGDDSLIERGLPRAHDIDAETPRLRCVGFGSTDDAGGLIVRRVVPVRVDRRRARLEPDAWWFLAASDRGAHRAGGLHSRIHDLGAVRGGVAAVDAAAGHVDHDVGAVDLVRPLTDGLAVPLHGPPRRGPWLPAQHDHVVPPRPT